MVSRDWKSLRQPRRGLRAMASSVLVEIRLQDDGGGVHVDVFLSLAPRASAGAQRARRLRRWRESRPRARPVCTFSAGAPRRSRGTSARSSTRACRRGQADHDQLRLELRGRGRSASRPRLPRCAGPSAAWPRSGVADGDADASGAEVDAEDGHGGDSSVDVVRVVRVSDESSSGNCRTALCDSPTWRLRRLQCLASERLHEELQSRRHSRGDAEGVRSRVRPELLGRHVRRRWRSTASSSPVNFPGLPRLDPVPDRDDRAPHAARRPRPDPDAAARTARSTSRTRFRARRASG